MRACRACARLPVRRPALRGLAPRCLTRVPHVGAPYFQRLPLCVCARARVSMRARARVRADARTTLRA